MVRLAPDPDFPCTLSINVPFPTQRLANTALQALQVDKELSPLVKRNFAVEQVESGITGDVAGCLRVDYSATTNRMLRVSVNAFMDSLRLVVEVMEQLDTDVLDQNTLKDNGVH